MNSSFLRALKEHQECVQNTSDVSTLDRKQYHLLFVYDRLKMGFPDHHFLNARRFLGEAYTFDTRFMLWKYRDGDKTYPVATDGNSNWASHNIRGELYLVHTNAIIALDKRLGNGVRWLRKEVGIIHPFKIVQQIPSHVESDWIENRTRAWMYVGLSNYWKSPTMTDNKFTTCGEYRTSRDPDLLFYEFLLKDLNG